MPLQVSGPFRPRQTKTGMGSVLDWEERSLRQQVPSLCVRGKAVCFSDHFIPCGIQKIASSGVGEWGRGGLGD